MRHVNLVGGKDTCKKGSCWLTGLKFKTKNKTKQKTEPSSHFSTGASPANCTWQRSLHWTACLCAELPACTVFLPSEPALVKVSWNPISPGRIEAFPIPWELPSFRPMRIVSWVQEYFCVPHRTSHTWKNMWKFNEHLDVGSMKHISVCICACVSIMP